ncbi:MAG: hypothetical protein WBY61_15195, partial [Terriglobales bacterium]
RSLLVARGSLSLGQVKFYRLLVQDIAFGKMKLAALKNIREVLYFGIRGGLGRIFRKDFQ